VWRGCSDKFGLSWQIIPKNRGELLSQANAREAMFKQRKIIFAEYFK
jgi:predicted 3-demethylubiquinone-9 3-methyltransferase (glyoxalase superfamily)